VATQKLAVGHDTSVGVSPRLVGDHALGLEGLVDTSKPGPAGAAQNDAVGHDSFDRETVWLSTINGAMFHAAALGPGASELSSSPAASLAKQVLSLGHAIAVSGS
jgi:hypothetical protein